LSLPAIPHLAQELRFLSCKLLVFCREMANEHFLHYITLAAIRAELYEVGGSIGTCRRRSPQGLVSSIKDRGKVGRLCCQLDVDCMMMVKDLMKAGYNRQTFFIPKKAMFPLSCAGTTYLLPAPVSSRTSPWTETSAKPLLNSS